MPLTPRYLFYGFELFLELLSYCSWEYVLDNEEALFDPKKRKIFLGHLNFQTFTLGCLATVC